MLFNCAAAEQLINYQACNSTLAVNFFSRLIVRLVDCLLHKRCGERCVSVCKLETKQTSAEKQMSTVVKSQWLGCSGSR